MLRAPHRAGDGGIALEGKVIFHYIPGQLVGKFEHLDQPLLFKLGERALLARCNRIAECCCQRISSSLMGVSAVLFCT